MMKDKLVFRFDSVDVTENKINGIKLIREFTNLAFGKGGASLLASKNLVDSVCADQTKAKAEREFSVNVVKLLLAVPMAKRPDMLKEIETRAGLFVKETIFDSSVAWHSDESLKAWLAANQ